MQNDPYFVLSDLADIAWGIHQDTMFDDPESSRRALTLYNLIEDEYLEPARRRRIRANTEAYKKITQQLSASTSEIKEAIADIDRIKSQAEKIVKVLAQVENAIKVGVALVA